MHKFFLTGLAFYSCIFLFAQPAVRNEPRHHNVFENEYVRVLDVFLAPKDTTEFHVHETPSVFTTFTKTATASQLVGQPAVSNVSLAGYTWYDSLVRPRIHRVWNEDSNWFHVMDIELTGGKPYSNQPVLQNMELELLFNAPLTNGYHLNLKAGSRLQLPVSSTGYLLVSLGDVIVECRLSNNRQHRLMKAGHYNWVGAGDAPVITVTGESTGAFLLLQLK